MRFLVFPVAGCLAYYFMEVFPASGEERALRRREGCLEGAHANDPATLFDCARARFHNERRSALESEQQWVKLATRELDRVAA